MTITQLDNGYILVPREDWGARHSPGRTPMPRPVAEVNIHHTVTAATGDPCGDMRVVENVLNQRDLDPGYSYTAHPSGVILVGAGEMKGAHTAGRNSVSYGISLIGNYDNQQPTLAQLVNVARTINLLRLGGRLVPDLADLVIQGHRATKATACPGANMVEPNLNGASGIDWIRWFVATGV